MAAVAIYGLGDDPFGLYRGKFGDHRHGHGHGHRHEHPQQTVSLYQPEKKNESFM